jgi:tetratricopeptide (TPR) repeat protein
MKSLKKLGLLLALFFWCALGVMIYWNSHLYYSSLNRDEKAKIARLEEAVKFFPLNDLVFYELGKAYFDLGFKNLHDAGLGEANLQKAVLNLKKSVMINPASSFSHFFLGQALLYLDLISPQKNAKFGAEFRKAVQLAGENMQILREVGALFLSHWPELSEEERNTTSDILNRIVGKIDQNELARLLSIWEMNLKDYSVMDKILPADARLYRQYAEYLGEKSLSLEERLKYLARAEQLEFAKAKEDCQMGEALLSRYQVQSAMRLLNSALSLLRGIRFYQALNSTDLVSSIEYKEVMKATLLALVKTRIEEGTGLSEILDHLYEYLALEDRASKVAEIETLLRDRKLLPAKFDQSFDDLSRLAFELRLQFSQSRYREIVNFGRDLGKSLVLVPANLTKDYIKILLLIGDSHQKVDFLYDAGDFYQRALEIDPNNLEVLLRLRQNYDRLNEEKKLSEINKTIEKIIAANNLDWASVLLKKGEMFSRSLVFDGRKIILGLQFGRSESGKEPLLAVFFNSRVVWEGYLKDDLISLSLDTEAGENELRILTVNGPVSLAQIGYSISDTDDGSKILRR